MTWIMGLWTLTPMRPLGAEAHEWDGVRRPRDPPQPTSSSWRLDPSSYSSSSCPFSSSRLTIRRFGGRGPVGGAVWKRPFKGQAVLVLRGGSDHDHPHHHPHDDHQRPATVTNPLDSPEMVEAMAESTASSSLPSLVLLESDDRQVSLEQGEPWPGGPNPDQVILPPPPRSGEAPSTADRPSWREALPDRLARKSARTLQKLTWGSHIDLYLLGTAHVSNDSSADVRMLLEHVRPQAIVVELCEARVGLLQPGYSGAERNDANQTHPPHPDGPTSVVEAIPSSTWSQRWAAWWTRWTGRPVNDDNDGGEGSLWQSWTTFLLTRVQQDYAQQLGVELGGEFKCAYRYWLEQQQQPPPTPTPPSSSLVSNEIQPEGPLSLSSFSSSLPPLDSVTLPLPSVQEPPEPVFLILGDRPLSLTLVRAWESLTWWWPKLKVTLGLLWSCCFPPSREEIRAWLQAILESQDQGQGTDLLTQSLSELRQQFPTLYTTIIEERDAWLAAKLIQTARALSLWSLSSPRRRRTRSFRQQSMNHPAWPSLAITPEQEFSSTLDEDVEEERLSIVAIVGAGHISGICQWLTNSSMVVSSGSVDRPSQGAESGESVDTSSSMPSSTSASKLSALPVPPTPEQILAQLVTTRRWAHDPTLQQELIPQWIQEVVVVPPPTATTVSPG